MDSTRDTSPSSDHYWPYYCEENVWHDCAPTIASGRDAFATFVSNDRRSVAMWEQRAAAPGFPIVWDYHVVLLLQEQAGFTILDRDCRLGPALSAGEWLEASFHQLSVGDGQLAPCFRLVPAEIYRRELRSDRSHMRCDGAWIQAPPPWPTIGSGMNLMRFVDMQADFHGELVDLETLRQRVSSREPKPSFDLR